jgi:hypothetical protein
MYFLFKNLLMQFFKFFNIHNKLLIKLLNKKYHKLMLLNKKLLNKCNHNNFNQ